MEKVEPLIFDSYMAVINNSAGTKLFRNFYARVNGKKRDIMADGVFSCAFYVSGVLKLFDLIEKSHGTVNGTVRDLQKSGWKKISKPNVGSVLVWNPIFFEDENRHHQHIGFYLGNGQAVSNNYKKRYPTQHGVTFGTAKRKIQAIYWHEKLSAR